jgi:hypothetical protein
MPKIQSEEDKKHGDKLESLVDRASSSSAREADESPDDEDDPALLQDDDDEDVQNDET